VLTIAYIGMPLAAVGFVVSCAYAVRSLRRWTLERAWHRHEQAHESEVVEVASEIDDLIAEIREWDRRKNHYRHNIHCPRCGRFSRQATEWPAGIADCGTHGVTGMHVELTTGTIPIIVHEIAAEIGERFPAVPDFVIPLTEIDDDLKALEEAHAPSP
jgi:hypothetical protein